MSHEAQGWDPTVEDATEQEIKDFTEAVENVCKVQAKGSVDPLFFSLVKSVGNHGQYPRKKVSVLDGEETKCYIIGCPIAVVRSVTG